MARPKKRTVDYFPHQCNHGKTMYIIEQKYGNDGYAFWFKLLELLGTAEGHYLQFINPEDWEFLQAKTRTSDSFCQEILDLLARLDAIDRELWESYRVVWIQNFVDGIADVYRNRRAETPKRPCFYNQKPGEDEVSTPDNPQSKLKETIVKETIINTPSIIDVFNQNIHPITPLEMEKLDDWLQEMPEEVVIEAIKEAVSANVRKWSYINGILTNWKNEGITTLEGVMARKRDERGAQVGKDRSNPPKSDAAKRFYSKTLDDI